MTKNEYKLFEKAIKLIDNEFYIDSIEILKKLYNESNDNEIKDDILFDIGICYLKINDIDDAIKYFKKVIEEYPEGKILNSLKRNEFGKITDKSYYALIHCYLLKGNLDKANQTLDNFDKENYSYVIDENSNKRFYKDLAKDLILEYKIR